MPVLHVGLRIFLPFPASDHAMAIGKEMVIDDGNQSGLIQLIQHFKEAFPFAGWKSADKPVYFLRRCMGAKVDAAVFGKMLVVSRFNVSCFSPEILFHRITPLPLQDVCHAVLLFRNQSENMSWGNLRTSEALPAPKVLPVPNRQYRQTWMPRQSGFPALNTQKTKTNRERVTALSLFADLMHVLPKLKTNFTPLYS